MLVERGKQNTVTVIDVRRDFITLCVANERPSGVFSVEKIVSDSFKQGFNGLSERERISGGFEDVLNKLLRSLFVSDDDSERLKKIPVFISVPAELVSLKTKVFSQDFKSRKAITKEDLKPFFDLSRGQESEKYTPFMISPVSFLTESKDNILNPVGQVSSFCEATLIYYSIRKDFDCVIENALASVGVDQMVYYPATLAQSMYFCPESERIRGGVLIESFFSSTSISRFRGNAVIKSKTFRFGLGHLIGAISQEYGYDQQKTVQLLDGINLYCQYESDDDDDYYSYSEQMPIRLNELKDAVFSIAGGKIFEKIQQFLQEASVREGDKVYISSQGGLFDITGMDIFYTEETGMEFTHLCSSVPFYNRSINNSLVAGLRFAFSKMSGNYYLLNDF